eukprot:TRINITY_DN109602_c0_g1_i1.p1 TRINITY_DN109602_c0_g1~~TRINITY_DN109602_c0_g1_i1.p1  ORF type:complete len:439 (-),score=87.68 TRINITY_DN109602_c0_g1_i1:29-1249(-)
MAKSFRKFMVTGCFAGKTASFLALWLLAFHLPGAVTMRTEDGGNSSVGLARYANDAAPREDPATTFTLGEGTMENAPTMFTPTGESEQLARYRRRLRQLDMKLKLKPSTPKEILLALGGGTGAGTTAHDEHLTEDLLLRMRCQDKMVLLLMLVAYFVSLLFSASLAFRQACNDSPIKFYGDPRVNGNMLDSNDLDEFLEAFNGPPSQVQLQVQGLIPVRGLLAHMLDSSVQWQGNHYLPAFSYCLDLSSWLVPGERDGTADDRTDGVSSEDVAELDRFLQENQNDLGTVEFRKNVIWPGWEELATNIKQKIRQQGFDGIIHVSLQKSETLTVYKNRPWANFLHMSSTRTLCALSVFGYLWYAPYMWLRQRGPVITSNFHIDLDINDYWQLIGDKVSDRGFDERQMR